MVHTAHCTPLLSTNSSAGAGRRVCDTLRLLNAIKVKNQVAARLKNEASFSLKTDQIVKANNGD